MTAAVRRFGLAVMLTALTALAASVLVAAPRQVVYVLEVKGVIDPPAASYIARGVEVGAKARAQAVIIRLDTPGGLDKSMRDITQTMLSAEVPVVVYVAPKGARAASAGAIITLASHVAAMAPGTNIGAAHPVAMGGGEMTEEMSKKVENDAASTARAIAERRGRNAKWAEAAVRESISSSASEALKAHVIDVIAEDLDDLLARLDGRKVKLPKRTVTLHTTGATTEEVPMSVGERFLHVLSDPNLAYIFLMIGIYGIIFELQSPGAVFPGVIGVICLVMAFYSLAVLEANLAGVILIILGVGMLVADIWAPSHGVLTIGGIIAFVAGSLMLYGGPSTPSLRVSWLVVVMMTALTAGFFLLVVGLGVRAHWTRVTTGIEGLMGAHGKARTALRPEGSVLVAGELWRAVAAAGEEIEPGAEIEVLAADGFTLRVRRRGDGQA
ncbi:MAG TPA: nodulation protein NfeD [Armatimonadota bacterium]|nr:nodulation protein NfeD [Armatimonadota bacterium]